MVNKKQIKKILIVVLDNLGDAVMGTPVVLGCRRVFPKARIGIWLKDYAAPIFEGSQLIDKIHASDPFWDSAPGRSKGDRSVFRRVWKEIRSERYDLAIVLNTEWRRALACRLAGIPVRIGYDCRGSRHFLTHAYPLPEVEQPRIFDHRTLLERYSGQKFDDDLWIPTIEPTSEEIAWGVNWRKANGWSKNPIVLLHPFSGDPLKSWPVDRWFKLVQTLSDKNSEHRFVFICSPFEADGLKKGMNDLSNETVKLIAGGGLELKGIVSQSDIVIGTDSSIGHLASAMGKPILSLFAITSPAIYAPKGKLDGVVIKRQSMKDIEVNEVISQFLRLHEQSSSAVQG